MNILDFAINFSASFKKGTAWWVKCYHLLINVMEKEFEAV